MSYQLLLFSGEGQVLAEHLEKSDSIKKSDINLTSNKQGGLEFYVPREEGPNKNLAKILRFIKRITEEVNEYSSKHLSEECVLIEGVPVPASRFSEFEDEKDFSEQKSYSVAHKLLIGILLIFIVSSSLGFITAFLSVKANYGIWIFTRAFLYYFLPAGLYYLVFKSISRNDKIWLLIIATLTLFSTEISLGYFLIHLSGGEVSIGSSTHLLFHKLFISQAYRTELTVGFAFVLLSAILPSRFNGGNESSPTYGWKIDDEYYDIYSALKKGTKVRFYLMIASPFIFLGGILCYIINKPQFGYISSHAPYLWFISSFIGIFLILSIISISFPKLQEQIGSIDFEAPTRTMRFFEVGLYTLGLTSWLLALMSHTNVSNATSGERFTGVIRNSKYNGKTGYSKFLLESSITKGYSLSLKPSFQPHLIDDANIGFLIKKGALGGDFITDLDFSEINSLEKVLANFKKDSQLRRKNFKAFEMFDNSKFYKKKIEEWKKQCESIKDYSCRLLSYHYGLRNRRDLKIKYLTIGCTSGRDPVACYGYFFDKRFEKLSKQASLEILRNNCLKNRISFCRYYALSLSKINPAKHHKTINDIYKKIKKASPEEKNV